MNWETSNSEIRKKIGIQFFAEGSAAAVETAETDGFESGFFDDGENQPTAETEETLTDDEPAETVQVAEEATEDAPAPLQEETEEATQERFVPLVFNGQQTNLPESAVQVLSGALGGDVVSLIQKGMNYENRGAREIGILDRYAQASGYDNRAAYLDAMEQQLGQHQIDSELARLMEQYPDAPEDALRPIAERTVSDRSSAERAQREQEAADLARAEMMKSGEEMTRPWAEFLRVHPEVDAKTLEKGFFELVNSGLPPVAAYERIEAQKARAEAERLKEQLKAAQKNTQNRQTAVGTMASATLDSDPFLAGFGKY